MNTVVDVDQEYIYILSLHRLPTHIYPNQEHLIWKFTMLEEYNNGHYWTKLRMQLPKKRKNKVNVKRENWER